MKKRLLLVFLLIIFLPITVMTVMAVSAYKQSRQQELDRRNEEASAVLISNARLLRNRLSQVEAELEGLVPETALPAQDIRDAMGRQRLIKQAFILDETNAFLYPDDRDAISQREKDFVAEAEKIDLAAGLRARMSPQEDGSVQPHWYTWFMGDGINFIYYFREGETLKGYLLERYALIGELINVLPPAAGDDSSFRIRLTDARGNILYQWGGYVPEGPAEPLREYSLKEPLGSWRLFYYHNPKTGLDHPLRLRAFFLLPGVVFLVVLVAFLSLYFYRENTREMKTAQNQVSFVNQVSHELKTPLTNIRLYSELLQNRLTDPKDLRYLDVIVKEGTRLGRMINNVLTFNRGERGELKKKLSPVDLTELIREVLDKFKPLLEEHAMETAYEERDIPVMEADRDMIEQILVNLIGNAVKYGAAGQYLGIETEWEDGGCAIFIRDKGPGIDDAERNNIFKPFYRIDNSLSQKHSGTGIGLSIARKLAEECGAVLRLEKPRQGACFSLTIPRKDAEH